MSFWGELKRRNVYKVGVAYAIVAWLLIQAASIIFPHLSLPSWAVTLLIVFLIACFPIALLLAWAYEVTPEGIKRTKEVPLAESITHLTGQKLNYIVTGLLVLAVGFILVKDFYIDRQAVKPEMVSTETEQAPVVVDMGEAPKTIAVLPFADLSPEKDQEYFVDGLSEELLNCLSKIAGLRVTSRTSSFTFKGSEKTIQEIASVLGVDHILEGSVRKAGNALRIIAQLIRAKDDYHLWSETYNRELKDIFEVQEDIATAVADELKLTLGIEKSIKQLGGTDNEKAYEYYLIAKGKQNTYPSINIDFMKLVGESLKSLDAALALDPKFALAWALRANAYLIFLDNNNTADRVASDLDSALTSVQKAIELEPNLAEGYHYLGAYRRVKGDWIEAELAYRKAMGSANEPLWDYVEYFFYYSVVGNFRRLGELAETAKQNDPFNQFYRDIYIWSLFLNGDMKRAEEENKSAMALFGDKWVNEAGFLHLASGNKVYPDEIATRSILVDDFGKKYLDSPKEGLAELRKIYNDTHNLTNFNLKSISFWAAYFGDTELAMDAMERSCSISTAGTHFIWYPIYKEVRQTPRFKKFVKKTSLIDYWNKFGWPDICHKLDNGDFECE